MSCTALFLGWIGQETARSKGSKKTELEIAFSLKASGLKLADKGAYSLSICSEFFQGGWERGCKERNGKRSDFKPEFFEGNLYLFQSLKNNLKTLNQEFSSLIREI